MQIVERKYVNDRIRNIVIDGIVDRQVRSRNFGGEEKRHPVTGQIVNGEGKRNFLLRLSPEIADELTSYGCEVKLSNVQGPNDVAEPYVSVEVSYYLSDQGYRDPIEAVSVSNGNPTFLDRDHIRLLNSVDISNMCLTLEISGKQKVHKNGVPYTPVYAQRIIVIANSNYVNDTYANFLRQPGAPMMPGMGGMPEMPMAPAAPMGQSEDIPF